MKSVIIMRGPSGSGKSTFVKKNFPTATVVSADKYFEREVHWSDRSDVVYQFDPIKIGEAHAWCFNQYLLALFSNGASQVIVDNTNTRIWEFANYMFLARKKDYKVTVITTYRDGLSALDLSEKNIHGVPPEIIERMINNYERFPGEILAGSQLDL